MNLDPQATAALYKTIIDNLPYATGLFDNKLQYIYFNKAAEKITRIPISEALGKSPYEVLPQPLQLKFIPLLEKVIESAQTINERIEVNIQGNDRVLSVQFIPILDEEEKVQFIIGITEDLTELENQRSDAITNARLASLGHMAANITHEINNPMQLIQLRLFRLEEMIESQSGDKEKMLSEIKDIFRTTKRVSKIIDSVRRQAKRNCYDGASINPVRDIVNEAISYSRNLIDFAKAELILDLQSEASINCNAIEVEQVLINLISNGCDAISNLDERWIKISSFNQNDEVVIQVTDSGLGISEENQKNLMKPFFTTKQFNKGTGLGLNLSRTLIKRNNGQLNYLPEKENTTFEIRLKLS